MERKQESFMRGALVLTLAALVSRVLGAIYKPIVTRLFAPFDGQQGDAGMGLTAIPLASYQVILSFTSVGFNIAISRLVAERLALGDQQGAWRVFRLSMWFMGISGAVLSVLFWLGAPHLASVSGRPEAAYGFIAMAPSILLVSVMAAYRGLFQGFQQMTPNAMSQIYEQIIRVLTGVALVWALRRISIPIAAAGYNFGDGVGAIAGLAYLVALYRRARASMWSDAGVAAAREGDTLPAPAADTWAVIKEITRQSLPISLIGAVLPLIMWTDSFLVIRRLAAAGITGLVADGDYGRLSNAFTIINLPAILTTAIYVSLVPAVAEALALGNREQARSRSITAFRVTMLFALPSALGIYILADPIYRLVLGGTQGGAVLQALAWGTLFLMVQQTSSGILQGAGQLALPVRNLLIAAVIKVVLTYSLTGIPGLGVTGAAYATVTTFAVAGLLNLRDVQRHLGAVFDAPSMLIKPGLAALAMAGAVVAGQLALVAITHRVLLAGIIMMPVGALVYGLVLLSLGGIAERDLLLMPRIGERLAATLKRLGMLRN